MLCLEHEVIFLKKRVEFEGDVFGFMLVKYMNIF